MSSSESNSTAKPRAKRATRFCITINNPPEPYGSWPFTINYAYACYQLEEAPTTGTLHYQMYVRYHNRRTVLQVIGDFPGGHVTIANGNEGQNYTYCTKDPRVAGPWFHWPDAYDPNQGIAGKRTDIDLMIAVVKRGATATETFAECGSAMIRYPNAYQTIRTYTAPPPTRRPVRVMYIWGEPGTGKTHYVTEHYKVYYSAPANAHPFDQYNEQDVMIFDEFNSAKWDIADMNRLLDVHPYTLPCRYANRQALYTKVIIISNYPLDDQYSGHRNRSSFLRRIHTVFHWTGEFDVLQPHTPALP